MVNGKSIAALLPMKANSERVVGKNFRDFCGKPLYQWILDTLLSVQEIDKVIINTDAKTLLEDPKLTANPRVLLRPRPKEICGDLVSMNLVIADDLKGTAFDHYVMTHSTNPILSAKTIRAAMDLYFSKLGSGYDSLFTVNRHQTRFYGQKGEPINHDPNNLVRTQDLAPWFEENSNLYIFSKSSFAKTNARIGAQPVLFEMTRLESVDIDDADSWKFAEAVQRLLTRREVEL